MSPCSDLTLTQVLTVFTDGEAEAQRWEWGQAWGREWKVGVQAVLVRPLPVHAGAHH